MRVDSTSRRSFSGSAGEPAGWVWGSISSRGATSSPDSTASSSSPVASLTRNSAPDPSGRASSIVTGSAKWPGNETRRPTSPRREAATDDSMQGNDTSGGGQRMPRAVFTACEARRMPKPPGPTPARRLHGRRRGATHCFGTARRRCCAVLARCSRVESVGQVAGAETAPVIELVPRWLTAVYPSQFAGCDRQKPLHCGVVLFLPAAHLLDQLDDRRRYGVIVPGCSSAQPPDNVVREGDSDCRRHDTTIAKTRDSRQRPSVGLIASRSAVVRCRKPAGELGGGRPRRAARSPNMRGG